jgi:hypothetical protein
VRGLHQVDAAPARAATHTGGAVQSAVAQNSGPRQQSVGCIYHLYPARPAQALKCFEMKIAGGHVGLVVTIAKCAMGRNLLLCLNGAAPNYKSYLAATAVVRSAGEMRTPKRSHQIITVE